MPQRTPLYDRHVGAGARVVDFAGWEMPLHYGSQLAEHQAVRSDVGLFDVSHMAVTDLSGPAARGLLRQQLANDVAKLDGRPGQALYSCLLNERGGVVDDLIVYLRDEETYRVVSNAATREKVRPRLLEQAQQAGVTAEARDDLAMVAVQGPRATSLLEQLYGDEAAAALACKPFQAATVGEVFAGRTGYTGEDGFELILPADQAPALWDRLTEAGAQPCGLGARDSLRLEAGLNLNGNEMDEETTPLEAALGWTVAWAPEDRDFVGRAALEEQHRQGVAWRLIGLVVEGRAPARAGYVVRTDAGDGVITSGAHSPTLGGPIALARIPADAEGDFRVVIRNREAAARRVKPPFVRHGKVCV
ncbi:MAG: glycine cleavage system aminomethyltransferase GcvT [Halorhodospira halophila]|uniref:glycine cleavage system aminomethyltransferase GcvT n=1 Tax=Halorhodospira TaxID=85108 RepID=UPI001EE78C10|nr:MULTISPECIES: glycine cleavage system aminomethyltransferase GcvT [Halorhodospira]MCC3750151.1 glycine cleavage system aminomethyltransferase GcvT [Halorhodospira halophila]MCG5527075.1 glycine cleavage system aminomethyltransferase GcvT [Halorhodospira halophila]MCG5532296.1 glycine cleavage system aminomethyltransferase GcvT [Halorhodospira sp. 9621]MCG5538823.1 glycine cleavage system aminomethyltransferase GcvT [Halorhodospira sp. 9622]MCG5541304.1 glycine cleavage system aminomethyltra